MPLCGQGDRLGDYAEREDQLERLVEQRDRAKPHVPTRGLFVFRVDRQLDAANRLGDGQGPFTGRQQEFAAKPPASPGQIDRETSEAKDRDGVAAEIFFAYNDFPMRGFIYAFAPLIAALVGFGPAPAWAQFNPFSGIVTAIEAAAEDRSASDIALDAKIKTVIVARLTDKLGREGALLGVDVYEQDVMLTGTVPLAEIKNLAGQLATGAEGAKKVHNEVLLESAIAAADKNKSSANVIDDTVIEGKLRVFFTEAKGVNVTNWRWRSVKGRVFLFGRALNKAEHDKATEIAKGVADVVAVVNRAKIKPKT